MLKELSKTDQFINEGLKEIDNEVKADDEIKAQASYITDLLSKNPVVRVEYNGDMYTLSFKRTDETRKVKEYTSKTEFKTRYIKVNVIILAAVNETNRRRAALANKAYLQPAIYKGEYNDEFTERENLLAVVESFLRHAVGEIKIESNDEGSIAKIIKER